MDSGHSTDNGAFPNGHPGPPYGGPGLPPVDPPSARFILQLFLVPGLLVAMVVGFIWLFFGWLGGGPETPDEFLEGLRSPNEQRRWRTAQDLAQVLPRKKELRGDVGFALAITTELHRGLATEPASEAGEKADLMEFLPAAAGTFHVPVAAPVLAEMVRTYADDIRERNPLTGEDQNQVHVNATGLRLRNAVVAIGLLGARLKEYDALSDAEKQKIHDGLHAATGEEQRRWAKAAAEYLADRDQRTSRARATPDTLGVVQALRTAARSKDELTRKYAILSLANWDEPNVEDVLAGMTDVSGVEIVAVKDPDYRERAGHEIRFNAVLALARRNSQKTDWRMVAQTLDPDYLDKHIYKDPRSKPNVDILIQKSLNDLREWAKHYESSEKALDSQPRIKASVERLTEHPNAAVQVSARKLLGGDGVLPGLVSGVSRQTMLIIGLSAAIGLLLLLAAVSRWRRKPVGVDTMSETASSADGASDAHP